MLTNIIDGRDRKYRWKRINAVIEAAWHDNPCKESDQSPQELGGPDYLEFEHITVAEAVEKANSYAEPVTLFIYDSYGGIYTSDECERRKHDEAIGTWNNEGGAQPKDTKK